MRRCSGRGRLIEDCDAACFELGDDLAEGLRAGGVEDLEVGQPQDDHLDVADGGELGEEALGGAEEQRAVEAVDEDVVVEQPVLVVDVDQDLDRLCCC